MLFFSPTHHRAGVEAEPCCRPAAIVCITAVTASSSSAVRAETLSSLVVISIIRLNYEKSCRRTMDEGLS